MRVGPTGLAIAEVDERLSLLPPGLIVDLEALDCLRQLVDGFRTGTFEGLLVGFGRRWRRDDDPDELLVLLTEDLEL